MTVRTVDNSDRLRGLSLTPVSRETEERLAILVAELERWQRAKNLVSTATLDEVWTRHIADSLQLFDHAPEARRWLDLGSGGGFPGLVLGIRLAEVGGHIDLVESNARKCAFLRHAARLTGAAVTVHAARIEDAMPQFLGKVDVVTARALASLPLLLDWCKELLRTGVIGVFPKGQHLDAELTEASKYWKIQASTFPSVTDSAARILVIRNAQKRTDP
ncbi:16S rRNA (guanine(527)-N(7))-methyltransferase RsmG [Bosea sp. (in: a-proteobacteria)]|jgi:16S rRNA (guanine527-N7)-methyltransferase|uniref:16S rRNA (guanine(527)-N(7))-methyltransferase RsmG n=1 Tax=Bosea sp. (in: a-proteobacteria) TaxID=1871050 RepID=UPI001AC5A6AD|nr:16S rRNA (guanine(527)-N(7))-methyltransferase RsmG [Bosea sp. (in: a-proteobacteria)]MBN9437611.1 16S rRNA (guanine(527)-N(7))-methyltransferase RsmG [Bosea sp. (in: a-proteobacteria)]